MSDVATFMSGHKPRTKTVGLCPDSDLLAEIARLRREAEQAGKVGSLADTDINQRLTELRDEAEQSQFQFVIRSVGRAAWSILSDRHQPDKDKRAEYLKRGQRLDWDPDTFPPAAIGASLVEATSPDGPTLEFREAKVEGANLVVDPDAVELASRVWDEFEFGEVAKLWQAVVELNVGTSTVPKSVTVFGATRSSSPNSGQPETTTSPVPSSSDGGSLAG